jgi:multidrug efflux system membrane fusion protein
VARRKIILLYLLSAGVLAATMTMSWHYKTQLISEAKAAPSEFESDIRALTHQVKSNPHQKHRDLVTIAAVPVVTVNAWAGDVPISLDALGTVTPLATAIVKPQLNGYLTQIGFSEGQMVKQGDFLAEIDPRPYQIALEQAQGQLAHDEALLKNANVDLDRYSKLSGEDAIAHQQLDTQHSLVQQVQATIISDQAQVDNAKLNLDYCHIVAPVTGQVGLRQVDRGNYVQAGQQSGLAVITQLTPISVVFAIPEDNIRSVKQQLMAKHPLNVTVYDHSRATKLASGTVTSIDNEIDDETGTVKLRASFDNDDDALFPDQFVNVNMVIKIEAAPAIVPLAAIQHGASGDFVYVVMADSTVAVHQIKTGPGSGDNISVLAGLSAGDKVVIEGVDRLHDGSLVIAADTKMPTSPVTEATAQGTHN